MYKTISKNIIKNIESASDLLNFISDDNEELPIKEWVQKYRDIVPAKDIFRLLLREEFMPEKDFRLFAVWSAKESLKLIENPDKGSVEVCNVAERYVNGQATKDELNATYINVDNALSFFIDLDELEFAPYEVAHVAYVSATDDNFAAEHVQHAAVIAYHIATEVAHYASNNTAARDAAFAFRIAQIDKLLTYFE
jgi:hypothetical protein